MQYVAIVGTRTHREMIANVKLFNDDIAHVLQNTKKRTYFVQQIRISTLQL